jgi:hypothetical protein
MAHFFSSFPRRREFRESSIPPPIPWILAPASQLGWNDLQLVEEVKKELEAAQRRTSR